MEYLQTMNHMFNFLVFQFQNLSGKFFRFLITLKSFQLFIGISISIIWVVIKRELKV